MGCGSSRAQVAADPAAQSRTAEDSGNGESSPSKAERKGSANTALKQSAQAASESSCKSLEDADSVTTVQAFELKAAHSIIKRSRKDPAPFQDHHHGLQGSASPIIAAGTGAPVSLVAGSHVGRALPPVDPRRSSLHFSPHQAAQQRRQYGSANDLRELDGPVALHRGRDQDTGDPGGKPRFSVNGGAVNGILKSQSGKGGGRSIRPPGGRSIAFREAEKTTFVFDRDEEHEGGYGSEDEGHHSKRISAGFPLRLESMSGDHPELASGVSISSRAGSAALLAKKNMLAPVLRSSDSQASIMTVAHGLPPVKDNGHRSVGSRSVGGARSEVSFALAARDCSTPMLKGANGAHKAPRGDSAGSDASFDSTKQFVGLDSANSSRPGGPRRGASGASVASRLSRGVSEDGLSPPGSADEGGNGNGRPRSKGMVRNGKEWDAKGARWRRASVFQSAAHCAISLRFLRRLLTEYVVPLAQKLNLPLAQVSTLMVNEHIVKQLTKEEQCRLVDVPGVVPREDVGEPDYFISHAWSNPFAHLVQCVCDHLSGALDSTKVWIDIAAVNQHPSEQQQDDLANLRNAIHMSKATLVCLDVTGAPLKRVWCLYECDNTITIHGPDRLQLLTTNFSVKDMASVFKSISVVDAGAYKQSDKDAILEDIVTHHGSVAAFDNKLKLLFLLEPLDMQADLEALLEGTGGAQEYDFSPLQMWLTSTRAPQVCVISGPAGSGKSTISAALCWDEEARQRRQKALQKGAINRRAKAEAPSRLSDSAAISLVRRVSGTHYNKPLVHAYHFCKYADVRRQSPIRIVKTLAYQLAQKLPLLRSYYAGLDLGQVQQLHQASTAFRLLLLKPLTTLLPRDEQVVLLVDAMDEADTPSQMPLDNSVLQLMLHQLSSLPRNVRVITSTRSSPHLMGPLRRKFHGALELTPAMVRKKETTLMQVQRRLASRFGADVAETVMASGEGENNLVYYSVVTQLEPPLERVPASLPECYAAVFAATWPKLTPQRRKEVIKVLQVLMAAREPLQLSLLAGLGLDQALESLPGWGALLYEREYRVYTLHKSLHDWLADKQAAGEFFADPRVGHATLGRYLFNAAHPLPAYGAKYLVTHLLEAGREHLRELLDQAVTDLDHLEAVCRVGHVFKLHAELAAEEDKSRAVADVVRWLGLNSHVLWAHPGAVIQLANEAPNTSAFMIALKRPRRSSTITTELMSAAAGAALGAAAQAPSSAASVTLVNKRQSWPAQLSILAQHHRAVNSVSFNPSGTLLASGSEDKSVRLWDPLTGEQKAVLFGHSGQVLGVSFSPTGALIASASVDSTIRLWDANTGEEKYELPGHVDWVRDVAFAPESTAVCDGKLLASGGDDKTVKLWDLSGAAPTLKCTCQGHTDVVYSIAWSPGGKLLASGSADRSIRLWDPSTGRQAGRALVAHKFPVTCVAFAPNEDLLVSGSHDKIIYLWPLDTCRDSGEPAGELAGHMDKVLSVAFSPDGSTLISTSADGCLRLWDVAARRVKGVLLGHASSVVAAAFSPSGAVIASAASDNTVRLWDPRVACEGRSVEEAQVSHMDSVTSVAFSPSGHTVASAGQDWTVRLWDPSNGSHRCLLSGHTDVVRCVAFSPSGHLLASASSDWTVRLWDAVSGAERGLLQGHQDRVLSVAWAPNNRLLASSCHGGSVAVWDVGSLEQTLTLKGHTAPVHSVAFSPNSKLLASGSADRTVRLWHAQQGEQQLLIKGHKGAVNAVEFDPTGKLLASASLEERNLRVWDPASGALLCLISNAALCAAGTFSMFSLARHAPCVRAIALQPRAALHGERSSGGGPGAGGERGSPNGGGAAGFGRLASFNPQFNVLQPSMTMRLDRTANVLTSGEYNSIAGGMGSQPSITSGAAYGSCTTSMSGHVVHASTSARSSLEEVPRLMELVSEAENPILPIYTQFVTPGSVAVQGNKVVMSDGPHLYFFESNDGKLVGWKSGAQSAAP